MPRSPGRGGHRWRIASANIRRRAAAGEPCCLCGEKIDTTLAWPDPLSFSVEHRTPLSRGGEPLRADNLGPAHLHCNTSRGNGTRARRGALTTATAALPLRTSRQW